MSSCVTIARTTQRKKVIMFSYGGADPNNIFGICSAEQITPELDTDETVFSKVVTDISDYLSLKQNKELQRYLFHHTNQEKYGSKEKYYILLMQQAAMCDFTDTNAEIKSQLIAGSGDERATLKELSEPRVTLGKLQQFAKTLDNIQSEDYNPPNSNCQQLRRDSPWLTHPTGCQHKKQTPPSSKVKCRRHLASLEWYGSPGVVSYIDLDHSEFLVQHGLVLQHRLILDVVELPRSRFSMLAFDIPMPKIVPGFISIATRQCHSLRS